MEAVGLNNRTPAVLAVTNYASLKKKTRGKNQWWEAQGMLAILFAISKKAESGSKRTKSKRKKNSHARA